MQAISKLALTLGLFFFATTTINAKQIDRIIAVVNDDIIMHSELKRIKNNKNKLIALEKLIDQRLREQIIKDLGVDITPDMINDAIKQIAANNKISIAELKKTLPSQGLNMRSLRAKIKKEIQSSFLQQRVLKGKYTISDKELKAKIKQQPKSVIIGERPKYYHVGHILIALDDPDNKKEITLKQSKAKAVVKKLRSGKNFETMAETKSDSLTAADGGDLGWRLPNDFPSLIKKALAGMRAGSIKGPIKNDSGFHIIKVLETEGGIVRKQFSYAERKKDAMAILMQEKADKYINKILRKYRDEAYIERRL